MIMIRGHFGHSLIMKSPPTLTCSFIVRVLFMFRSYVQGFQECPKMGRPVRVTPSYRVYKNGGGVLVRGWWVVGTRVRADERERAEKKEG